MPNVWAELAETVGRQGLRLKDLEQRVARLESERVVPVIRTAAEAFEAVRECVLRNALPGVEVAGMSGEKWSGPPVWGGPVFPHPKREGDAWVLHVFVGPSEAKQLWRYIVRDDGSIEGDAVLGAVLGGAP